MCALGARFSYPRFIDLKNHKQKEKHKQKIAEFEPENSRPITGYTLELFGSRFGAKTVRISWVFDS